MATRKVKFDFKPLQGLRVSKSKKNAILREVRDFVQEQVLAHVGESKTPVKGGSFKRTLSPEYKAFKKSKGGSSVADLELEGKLLNSLKVVKIDDNTLRLTVSDKEQGKADGHNNFSGNSKLPARNFIPDKEREQDLKASIWSGIRRIVSDLSED